MSEPKLKPERLNDILKVLSDEHQISVANLSKRVYTSKSTLRRDLISLEQDNIVRRQYGMVYLLQASNIEYAFNRREKVQEKEKRYICDLAGKLIPNNAALFLDGSSTNIGLTKSLADKVGLHVITNNLNMATRFNELKNTQTFMLGGLLSKHAGSVVGSATIQAIQGYRADFFLLSVSSLDENGVYSADPDQSELKRAMMSRSDHTILLVDHTKFDKKDFVVMFDFADIDTIVTDEKPSQRYLSLFEQNHVQVIYN
ncbi:DeoR/GlpR family DNA-binding transcription regulator [Lacticaseibacillus songhuajiangensis]|uniref:DeoR/GlpR family DNA-binding transcription regulator n=1 Tax=Lacticaseibacillus songhuajiangensis TaxID=1296539 RepID=UPI0013DE2B7F|nr:DeoR/GlpR family DNA-binding transcription regulator [Lacticaseibacillus songhuajiangensis]